MMMIAEAEKQVLIVLSLLAEQSKEASPVELDAAAANYFGMYRQNWDGALEQLRDKGFLQRDAPAPALSPMGERFARRLRSEFPRHTYFYNEFFERAASSEAHARFCERVYGKNLCQHGMLDMAQLERLVEIAAIHKHEWLLELGCGNGMVAETITDLTGAYITGIDTSRIAIQQAAKRTRHQRDRLAFALADMQFVDMPAASFDAVLAIDSLSFAPDLDRVLDRVQKLLRPGGRMAAFLSCWAGQNEPDELLLPDHTRLARILESRQMLYEVVDFTAEEIEHWIKKFQAALDLRSEFEQEGNDFLIRNRLAEAELHQVYVNSGRVRRYLYLVQF